MKHMFLQVVCLSHLQICIIHADNMKLSYPELLQTCEQIFNSVFFTFDQGVTVEKETCIQAKSRTWFEQRSGRVTASKLREVLHTDPLQPSISLIKSICYSEMRLFTSTACKYGCDHEDAARLKYVELFGEVHKKLANCYSVRANFGSHVSILWCHT